VLDNDMAGMIGRFLEGININHDTLAVDLIETVGPLPGFYLHLPHTREWWKKENYIPSVFDQSTYSDWEEIGCRSALDNAKIKTEEILANYTHTLPEDKEQELDRIIKEAMDYYKKKGLA
jgi:trimethylamine---corrinoid protein Co-methyltransferase